MSCAYVACTQLIDHQVLPPQFRLENLDRDNVWALVKKTKCVLDDNTLWGQKLEIKFADGKSIKVEVQGARGDQPELSNEEIVEKWRGLMKGTIGDGRRDQIEEEVLGLGELKEFAVLGKLLDGLTENPIA